MPSCMHFSGNNKFILLRGWEKKSIWFLFLICSPVDGQLGCSCALAIEGDPDALNPDVNTGALSHFHILLSRLTCSVSGQGLAQPTQAALHPSPHIGAYGSLCSVKRRLSVSDRLLSFPRNNFTLSFLEDLCYFLICGYGCVYVWICIHVSDPVSSFPVSIYF